MESHTPAAPTPDQTTATATTVTIPKAIESRNDVFITDHGSRCTSRRRALRVPRGRGDARRLAVLRVELRAGLFVELRVVAAPLARWPPPWEAERDDGPAADCAALPA